MLVEDKRNKDHIVRWLKSIDFINPFSITLIMRINGWRDISQNFRHFLNRLNKKYLKSSYSRYGNKLTVIPIIEGTISVIPHYHCIIDNPHNNRDDEFVECVKDCWSKTELSNRSVNIKKMTDSGWIDYMMKYRTKPSITDSIDWVNVNF